MSVALYMLDTCTASEAIRGQNGIDAKLQAIDPADICLSAISHAELRRGVALRREATRLAELVKAFLGFIRTESWDERAATHYATISAHLSQQGKPIGSMDEMIAGHALALDAVLVTNNEKHFRRVPGLRVENWSHPH